MHRLTRNLLSGLILIFFTAFFEQVTFAQTQASMNVNAGNQYKKADKDLNITYQKILKSYATQPIFIKNFKIAQRLWLQLRDAEVAARYPETGEYGSAEPMCRVIYLEKLMRDRTRFIKTWLDGIPEGDVCNGSVKFKK